MKCIIYKVYKCSCRYKITHAYTYILQMAFTYPLLYFLLYSHSLAFIFLFFLSVTHSASSTLSVTPSFVQSHSSFLPIMLSSFSHRLKDRFPLVLRKQRTDFGGTLCTTHVSQLAIYRRRSCVNG